MCFSIRANEANTASAVHSSNGVMCGACVILTVSMAVALKKQTKRARYVFAIAAGAIFAFFGFGVMQHKGNTIMPTAEAYNQGTYYISGSGGWCNQTYESRGAWGFLKVHASDTSSGGDGCSNFTFESRGEGGGCP